MFFHAGYEYVTNALYDIVYYYNFDNYFFLYGARKIFVPVRGSFEGVLVALETVLQDLILD